MADERAELTEGVVLRLAVRSAETDFIPGSIIADAGDFSLNSKERERVQNGDGIGSLSVWDGARTTPVQADAFLDPKERVAFRINVALVRALPFDLHVFRDPLSDPKPGADGHCALEDVWRSERRL